MIRIALCDDDYNALKGLKHRIEAYMQKACQEYTIETFLSGESLLGCGEYFDIVFLDIKMKALNGIETAKEMRRHYDRGMIVFVTALRDYVFDAFEVSAVNYLLKPIDDYKLQATLDRMFKKLDDEQSQCIMLNINGGMKRLLISGIHYCEIINHDVFIYSDQGMDKYQGKTLELERQLNASLFRCHRGYIVNMRHVITYKDGMAEMSGGERIPVSKRKHTDFLKALLAYHRDTL